MIEATDNLNSLHEHEEKLRAGSLPTNTHGRMINGPADIGVLF